MYTVYYFRGARANTTVMNDLRGACIVAYNEVTWLGCHTACVVDNETGEILREYRAQ